jgi:formate dehydrogenase iron-sulfur subunit
VGGTHVMYVLQHADRPEIYHGLPKDPHISPLVSLWKGALKPLALFGMGMMALGSFLHYVKVRPIDPDGDTAPANQPAPAKEGEHE